MLRIIILLITLSIIESAFWEGFPFGRRHHRPRSWYRKHRRYDSRSSEESSEESSSESNPEDILDDVVNKLIDVDKQLNGICQRNHDVIEEYQDGAYRRMIHVKDYRSDTVCVQIKHKIMLTTAQARDRNEPDLHDVKILDDALLKKNAFYIIEFDKLIINIPFKTEVTIDRDAQCNRHVDKRLITVPQRSPESYDGMDLRKADSPDDTALEIKFPITGYTYVKSKDK